MKYLLQSKKAPTLTLLTLILLLCFSINTVKATDLTTSLSAGYRAEETTGSNLIDVLGIQNLTLTGASTSVGPPAGVDKGRYLGGATNYFTAHRTEDLGNLTTVCAWFFANVY